MAAMSTTPLGAQSSLLSGNSSYGTPNGGLQFFGVTGFLGWQSVFNPQSGFLPNAQNLKGDATYGGSAAGGWSRRTEKGSFSVMYVGGYTGQVRYTNLSALNHLVTFSGSKKLSGKWNWGFSGTTGISTYDQLLFSPTLFSSVAAAPGSFDDLAAAVLTGKYNNDQLASLLTGAPMIESPERTLFFGNRIFTTSLATTLGYAATRRLTINFSSNASQVRHLNDGNRQDGPQYAYLLARATEGSADVAISYSLSPRTQLGVDLTANRGFSQLQQAYTTRATASINRTMGTHWFAQAHAGAGKMISLTSLYPVHIGSTPVYGGSLGYRTYAHTLLGAYDASLGQSYGAGAAKSTMINAAWNWNRPGLNWGLGANYMRMQFQGGLFGDVNGWRAGLGVSRRLSGHMTVQTGYMFAAYSSHSSLAPYKSAQHGVQLSVQWTPRNVEKR